MPRYQYRCKKCGHEFEVAQSMTEDALTDCNTCDGKVFRVIGGNVGIAFKGSGFYVNDSNQSASD